MTPRPAGGRHIFHVAVDAFCRRGIHIARAEFADLSDQRVSSMRIEEIGKMSCCQQIRHILKWPMSPTKTNLRRRDEMRNWEIGVMKFEGRELFGGRCGLFGGK